MKVMAIGTLKPLSQEQRRRITLAPKKLNDPTPARGVPQSPRWRVGLVCASAAVEHFLAGAISAGGSPGDAATLSRQQDGAVLAAGQGGGRHLPDERGSVDEADRLLKALPLGQANLLTFDLMPIGPLCRSAG